MTIGLPITVITLYVHQSLGFSNLAVGIMMGSQFIATLLPHSFAGRNADHRGAKRTMHQGLLVGIVSGVALMLAAAASALILQLIVRIIPVISKRAVSDRQSELGDRPGRSKSGRQSDALEWHSDL